MTENIPQQGLSADHGTFTQTWFLSAGETDAEARMPITLVAARAIEIATLHANALGIGYSKLAEHRMGWVLARLSIDMLRYPTINETYTMQTWIEGYNRFFSDRCYQMTDAEGRVVANIRSMWVAIDMNTRSMADLAQLEKERFPVVDRQCSVEKCRAPQIARVAETVEAQYTFKYCDIDFNRHVNTLRYIELVLNQRPLEFYDTNLIRRLDVSFEHECLFDETVRLLTGPSAAAPYGSVTEIHPEGKPRAVAVKMVFEPRQQQ